MRTVIQGNSVPYSCRDLVCGRGACVVATGNMSTAIELFKAAPLKERSANAAKIRRASLRHESTTDHPKPRWNKLRSLPRALSVRNAGVTGGNGLQPRIKGASQVPVLLDLHREAAECFRPTTCETRCEPSRDGDTLGRRWLRRADRLTICGGCSWVPGDVGVSPCAKVRNCEA